MAMMKYNFQSRVPLVFSEAISAHRKHTTFYKWSKMNHSPSGCSSKCIQKNFLKLHYDIDELDLSSSYISKEVWLGGII